MEREIPREYALEDTARLGSEMLLHGRRYVLLPLPDQLSNRSTRTLLQIRYRVRNRQCKRLKFTIEPSSGTRLI